ncbi:MAG TPA: hypothetical protein VGZ73_25765 [Bryobacteraceae bacterium]|jgi:anti-sigma factor RsiW|nr:hypothetical protein [Bryobacteraceae bacterium]
MNVPKEVIDDLLPVYLAGEASPATRAWLEEYLACDPELAERVRRQSTEKFDEGSRLALPPELELRALRRIRRMTALLRWLFGFGMGFSAVALSFQVSSPPLHARLLLLDYPGQLVPFLVAGVACWTGYFLLRRRLRATRV